MADYLNNQRKYVVSTTLKKADWNNSVLINGNVADEIARLKQQSGKDITVTGSRTLIQTLIHHDLVDEYSLLVHPLSLGTGQRLFGDECRTTLKLVASQALSSGVLHLTYQPERKS
jgi:dihydrofolate reductase